MKNKKKKNINKLVYKRLRLRTTAISSLSAGTDENWKGAPRSFSWLLTACLRDLQLLDSFFGNSNTVTVSQVVGRPSYDKRMSSLPFSILVFSLNSTNLLKRCWHGVWFWWTIFPVACAAGGIVVPGVLFWAAEPTLETRQASGDGRGDADYSQSSRGFVVKKTTALAR